MKIVQFIIPIPLTLEEYEIGHLYMVAKSSRQNSAKGDGVEVIKNEPYNKDGVHGQYTLKRMYISSRIPKFLSMILPSDALTLEEESWNAFPYTKTVYKNLWMKDSFSLTIESMHIEGADIPENPVNLSDEELKSCSVETLDIGEPVERKITREYNCNEDPTIYKSMKTERGPLFPGWWRTAKKKGWPLTVACKVMKIDFQWFGLQTIAESYAVSLCRSIFADAHRQQFCWLDEYFGLTMYDVRIFEKRELEAAKRALEGVNEGEEEEEEEEDNVGGNKEDEEVEEDGEKASDEEGYDGEKEEKANKEENDTCDCSCRLPWEKKDTEKEKDIFIDENEKLEGLPKYIDTNELLYKEEIEKAKDTNVGDENVCSTHSSILPETHSDSSTSATSHSTIAPSSAVPESEDHQSQTSSSSSSSSSSTQPVSSDVPINQSNLASTSTAAPSQVDSSVQGPQKE
ncbi:putative phosphatidylinositol transfer protein [Monocercomonoides exilis]|uniref:putative phosphatidylinositol transfer protein n=1 Tax=Monocercomonoides exilis TaxID=2049356 RepID=UPI00355A70EC|nr:putative phosphatidylinositol transfer protein [Monocercomonoides exilis]|eukprot:MONOS_10024.1-p1 / transcript=MONOS_10024.1 / gene=MONOS_10024 / organism=Monocercomonoides_exilis_PA203 / gene_product=phosphatidylinositol transfer protein / transcript_product=phosphatidylinositol transfer protein / location=Mono_scaffold00438:8222-9949(-) / protein_length=457 / sequence_SO=supercontig / SO=protein_coding / is_pseudo=false